MSQSVDLSKDISVGYNVFFPSNYLGCFNSFTLRSISAARSGDLG